MAARHGKRLDLMLELFMRIRDKKRPYTHREIASVLGCTWQNVYHIERRALRKLRFAARELER